MPYEDDLDPQKGQLLLRVLRAVAGATNGSDPYMAGHSARVADSCERIARAMGLSNDERFLLAVASWFHDIGNLATPAYILRKPSALAEDEMEEVRVHPVKGASVFAAEPGLAEVARAIRHHHERVDGTGYPDGLEGEAIPLLARIILVAEAYDAMTHHRPYRRALSHEAAVQRLRDGAGREFDRRVVEHFVAVTSPRPD